MTCLDEMIIGGGYLLTFLLWSLLAELVQNGVHLQEGFKQDEHRRLIVR